MALEHKIILYSASLYNPSVFWARNERNNTTTCITDTFKVTVGKLKKKDIKNISKGK